MNNIIKTFLRLLPVTVIGLLLNRGIIGQSDGGIEGLDSLVMSFFVMCFAVAFLLTLLKDRKVYIRTKLKSSFIPTVIGIIFFVSFFVTYAVVAARDKSPVLIFAGYKEDFYGAWFEFREDGTYKYANIRGLVGVTYTRGKYTLKDSLITLDTSKIDDFIESSLLIIRKEAYDTTEQVIYQINPQHNVVDNSTKFIISNYKRR